MEVGGPWPGGHGGDLRRLFSMWSWQPRLSATAGRTALPGFGGRAEELGHYMSSPFLLLREEDEEEYQEKIEQHLPMQEEDDSKKSRKQGREKLLCRHQQLQKQHVESTPSSNNEELRAMDGDETTHLKDDNDSNFAVHLWMSCSNQQASKDKRKIKIKFIFGVLASPELICFMQLLDMTT